MAQCKWCNSRGFFLRLSESGVCKDCAPRVGADLTRRLRVLDESLELMDNGKTLSTRLGRCDAAAEQAAALLAYEKANILEGMSKLQRKLADLQPQA